MRGVKWTYDEVKAYIESNSDCVLLSKEYKNVDTKLKLQCKCGNIFYKFLQEFKKLERKQCRSCILENNSKYNIENIKKYVEKESNSGCKLVSTNYINIDTKLVFQCSCGNEFSRRYSQFLLGKYKCKECNREKRRISHMYEHKDIVAYLQPLSFQLIGEYRGCKEKITLKCPQDHEFNITFDSFKKNKHCPTCIKERRIGEIKEKLLADIKSKGLTFISWDEPFTGSSNAKFTVICSQGHKFKTCTNNIRSPLTVSYCRSCGNAIAKSKTYKGTTPLYNHLRKQLDKWKYKSMKSCGFKCDITGGEFDVVHHLYGFNMILSEVISSLKYPIYQNIGDYTEEQLNNIENKNSELHEKYGLGVCLNNYVHNLFHKIYGKMNNTPEQYYEFKQRYLNGEFREVS